MLPRIPHIQGSAMLFPVIVLPGDGGPPGSHLLPLPGREPRWWVTAAISLAVAAFGVVMLGLALSFLSEGGDPDEDRGGDFFCLMLGTVAIAGRAVLFAFFVHFYYRRTWKLRGVARRLGMRFDARLPGAEVHDYAAQPVMAFAHGWPIATCNGLEGETDEMSVRVFDLAYQGNVGHVYQRVIQTVAVLDPVARGLRFSFGPFPSGRDDVYPQWALDQGFTTRLDLEAGRRSCVLYARGRADLAAIVPDSLCAELARLSDWFIESDGESLFVFRPGQVVAPERMEDFLDEVRAIDATAAKLTILTAAENAPPAGARPPAREATDAYMTESSEVTSSPAPARQPATEPQTRLDREVASVARRMAADRLNFKWAGQLETQLPL